MTLSRQQLSGYDAMLAKQETAAADYVRRRLSAWMAQNPGASVAEVREYAIECANDAATAYGDAASSIAADLYDLLADRAGRSHKPAAIDTSDVRPYIDKEAHYQAGKLVDGAPMAFVKRMSQAASDQVSRRANSTMAKNVQRDGIRYARVPLGVETCDFCLMLASRGFVYRSARTAGEGSHWHPNCRCKVIPGFSDDFTVEGYSGAQYEAIQRANAEIDADATLTYEQKLAAKRAVQEYNVYEYLDAYGASGISTKMAGKKPRKRLKRVAPSLAAKRDSESVMRWIAKESTGYNATSVRSMAIGHALDSGHPEWIPQINDFLDASKSRLGNVNSNEVGSLVTEVNPKRAHRTFHARTGGLSPEEYAEWQREINEARNLPRIRLSKREYAHVVSELNTHMTDEDRKHGIVFKSIGNYRYAIVNKGFSDYEFIRKTKLR